MPSVRYFNQSAPFWDFIASLEEQGPSQAFGQGDAREGAPGPSNAPWGSTNMPWGRRRPGPPPADDSPAGPPPPFFDQAEASAEADEKTPALDGEQNEKNEKTDEDEPKHPRCGRARGGWGPRGRGGCGGKGKAACGPEARGAWRQGGYGRGPAWGMGGGPWGMGHVGHFFQSQFNRDVSGDQDWSPPVDVFDTEASFVIHASLAGAKKEDIAVSWDAEKSELTITGIIQRPGDEEFLKTLALDERKVGAFERKVRLGSRANPAQIYVDGISAKLEDGVLRIDVPKEDKDYVEVKKVDVE